LPNSENLRLLWSPLFALYRYEQRAPGESRSSFLFDLITWRREPARREFHFGPLLSSETTPAAARIALAGGLLGLKRTSNGSSWHPFWFDFSRTPNNTSLAR